MMSYIISTLGSSSGIDAKKIQGHEVSTEDPVVGNVLSYNSRTAQWTPSSYLNDSNDVASLNWDSRILLDSSFFGVFDWDNRILYNNATEVVISLNTESLVIDSAVRLDWLNGVTYDLSSLASIDWISRNLSDASSYVTVNWDSGFLSWQDETSINWASRQLKTGVNTSLDWVNCIGYDSFGTETFSWQSTTLTSSLYTSPTLEWTQCLLYEVDSSVTSANWNLGQTYAGGLLSIDWKNRYLYNSSEVVVADWQISRIYNGSDGELVIDWAGKNLYAMGDVSATSSIDWQNRVLYDYPNQASYWTLASSGINSSSIVGAGVYAEGTTNSVAAPAFASGSSHLYLTTATSGTRVVSFTTAFPKIPLGGTISITTTAAITTLTLTLPSGVTILGTALAAMTAGQTAEWRKVSTTKLARLY